jgi:ketosteroid isomerase-like protein
MRFWNPSEHASPPANRSGQGRIRSLHADGASVIVLWDGRGVANDGAPYENSYAWFLTLKDGGVVDGTAFFDSISFNELWRRVAP